MRLALLLLVLVSLSLSLDDSSEEYPKPQKGKRMKKMNKVAGEMSSFGPMGPMPMGPFGFGPMGMGMAPDPFFGKGPMEGPYPPMPRRFKGKFKGGKNGGPPSPPFLQNVSEDARRQILVLMGDPNMTIEEKDARIEELLRNESTEAQESFTKFKTDMAARRVEMEQKLAELREKLSPAAKEADEALSKIMKDTSLSPVERREQIKEMFMSLPIEVKSELKELRRGMGSKVAMKIRHVGEFIGDVRLGLMDAFRSALGVGGMPEVRRAPMRRLKFPEPAVQLETKPIAISDDEKFVEF